MKEIIMHYLKLGAAAGVVALLAYFYGIVTAQRRMARELLAIYISAVKGSVARKEVGAAIALIADEFNRLRAYSSNVWVWTFRAIKSFPED